MQELILLNNKTATAGNNWLSLDSCQTNKIWKLSEVAAINRTRGITRIEFYIVHLHPQYGQLQYYFEQFNSPTSNVLCKSTKDIYLGGSDYVTVQFTGCNNGDQLAIYGFGIKYNLGEFDEGIII